MSFLARLRAAPVRLGCGVLLILVLAQVFNGGLSLSSLEKLYVRSLISSYEVSGQDFARKTQRAVRLGKPLELFAGVADLMLAAKSQLPDLDNIVVTAPDGRVLHSLRPAALGGLFRPGSESSSLARRESADETAPFRQNGAWHAPFRIEGDRGETAGFVYFSFPETAVDARVGSVLRQNMTALGATTAGALVFLLLAIGLLRPDPGAPKGRRTLWIILAAALVGAQAAYGYYNVSSFNDGYRDFARGNAETAAALLGGDVSTLLSKGVRLERLRNIEPHLGRIIQASPNIAAIAIQGADGRVLYRADKTSPSRNVPAAPDASDIRLPLLGPDGAPEGAVLVRLDHQAISARVFDITLDSVTVCVIALLFLAELMMLLAFSVGMSGKRTEAGSGSGLIMRPLAFLLIFAMDMVVSFIPLRMESLPASLGLPRDLLMGLPISAEFLCAGAALTLAGFWLSGRRARLPLFTGVLLIAAGYFYSGAATDAVHFLLARALTGVGYGLAIMSAQSFIIASVRPEARATGIANLFAGVYAGTLCGGAAGAMLSERIGYANVFYVSTAMLLLVAACVLLLLREPPAARKPSSVAEPGGSFALADLRRLLSDRDMLLLMLLSILPGGLLMTGFLNYLVPVALSRAGASQSDIGRVFMIYNLCLAYLAPFLARAADRSSRKKAYLFLAGMVAAAGVVGFALSRDVMAAAGSSFVLGLAGSLCLASQNAFALNLRVTREVGESKTVGVYNLAERIGQVIGPILLAWVVAAAGMTQGLLVLGACFLVAALLLLWLCRDEGCALAKAAETNRR